MKRNLYFSFLLLGSLLAGCNKDHISKVADVDFTVTADKLTCQAGDTVNFTFSGNPDFITFYSGETGHKYANSNRLAVDDGKPTLSFTTYATTVGTQENSLKILASTDFKGVYDTLNQNLLTATWIDLTDRAVLSTGADNTASGVIDIADINPAKKTIWFAFKKHDDNSPALKPWAWTIRSFDVKLYSPADNASYTITDLAGAGWYATDIANATYKWSITGTMLSIGGGGLNTPENEDWVVTNGMNIYGVAPDAGVAIKSIDARLGGYNYVFTTPGTYTVSFVATNQDISQKKQAIKEITITVNP